MMCHGPLDGLFRVVEEALEQNRVRRHDRTYEYPAATVESPVEAELARMYARAEIDRDTFLRLRPLARRGELGWADLDDLRREVRPRLSPRRTAVGEDVVVLRRIREKKAALEQARSDSQAVAQNLDQRIAVVMEEAGRLQEQARAVLSKDEEQARALLVRRQEALERGRALEERLRGLREDMQRIADLEAELDVKEQELKVLQARERLNALEEEIKERRSIDDGQKE